MLHKQLTQKSDDYRVPEVKNKSNQLLHYCNMCVWLIGNGIC